MGEPMVDPDEDVEWELVSSSREVSAGFVAFATLDPRRAVRKATGKQHGRAEGRPDRQPLTAPGPLAGMSRPRR